MRVFMLLRSDVREIFASMLRPGVAAVLTMGVMVAVFSGLLVLSGIDSSHLTMADFLGSMFGGMEVFRLETGQPFWLPITWLLITLFMLFLPLSYPLRDMCGFGLHVLVASSDRRGWWISKCLCLFVYVLAFWACAIVVSGIAALAWSALPEFTLSQDGAFLLRLDTFDFVSTPRSAPLFAWLGAAVLMSWALCMLQFALSLWIKPVLSYAVNVALLFTSAFFFSPALPGEYLMMGRSSLVIRSGVDPVVGMALAAALIVSTAVVGGVHFVRMDLVDKEFSS